MHSPLQIAVVGSGVGSQHIEGFQAFPDLFKVELLCDLDGQRAAAVAEKYRIPQTTNSFAEACERPDIDVIDICTPPNLHLEQITRALNSGKHVICEKPLVGSLAAADAVSALAKSSNCQVMPIFQKRFGHGLQKLKFLVDRNLAGEAFVFNVDVAWWRGADYYDNSWHGKRASELGGALLNLAIHAADMVLYILGPVKSVFGRVATRVNPVEVEDCVAMSVEMADGSLGTLSVTVGSLVQISRHRFTFRHVTAESNTEPYTNSREPWIFSYDAKGEGRRIADALEHFEPLPESYAGQFYRFYRALEKGTELPVTLADARASLELVAATYYASETHALVSLPIAQGHPKYETL
jgi:predicted dehydrogenase